MADYGDAADPAGGEAMVAAALERWGRLDICVANAAVGTGGMFHKQPDAEFGEVLEINLLGSARLARAAMAVMRPAGFGRIILVASTGGLHGDVGLSAYAASKGGAAGPGPDAGGRGRGPGRADQRAAPLRAHPDDRADGRDGAGRGPRRMDPDLVAPVLTALASPDCRLTGSTSSPAEAGCAGHRWWSGTRSFCRTGRIFSPGQLHALLAESGSGKPHEYRVAVDAFNDLMSGGPQ